MLIPLAWLREHVTVDETPEALADRLTMAGLEVEEIHGKGEDTVFSLKITPNRGDWLSIVGVAREVAALTGAELRLPDTSSPRGSPPDPSLRVDVEAPDLCPRYVGRLIRGVRHAAS